MPVRFYSPITDNDGLLTGIDNNRGLLECPRCKKKIIMEAEEPPINDIEKRAELMNKMVMKCVEWIDNHFCGEKND